MSAKTATVSVRIEPEIKERAEAILDSLGIPISVFIDMAYRQVIAYKGIPFSVVLPDKFAIENMNEKDFEKMVKKGIDESKNGLSRPAIEVFEELEERYK